MTTATSPSFYDVLEIPYTASQAMVRQAYHRLAHRFHPDKNSGRQSASKMREINEAYSTLSDILRRQVYDQSFSTPRTIIRPAKRMPATVFANSRTAEDMTGTKTFIQPGDVLFWNLSVLWDMPTQVHRVFHDGYDSYYGELFGWDRHMKPLCTVLIDGQDIVLFEEDLRFEWLNSRSHRKALALRLGLGAAFFGALIVGIQLTLQVFPFLLSMM